MKTLEEIEHFLDSRSFDEFSMDNKTFWQSCIILEKIKMWYFKKEGCHLSSMLMEYMDMFDVIMRPYFDVSELKLSVIRVIDNLLAEKEQ
jgi:hypothetical protein